MDTSGKLNTSDIASILGGITLQAVHKALKTHEIQTEITNIRKKIIPALSVRKLLNARGFCYPKLNISFQIVKGGVGKTSLSYALGLRASHYGAKILLVDLDQQGNLTRSLNVQARENHVWLNVIRDKIPINEAILQLSETLHILPSNLNNSKLDVELNQSMPNIREIVKDKLTPIRSNYDLVIFDCPPAINKINLSATCASDMVIIPLNPDPYAMDGLDFTVAELDRIKTEFKLEFITKIVWNRYDARERLGAVYMHALARDESNIDKVLPVVIRVDASLKNSIFHEKSVFDFSKSHGIREDFDQFAKEILGINQWVENQKKLVA